MGVTGLMRFISAITEKGNESGEGQWLQETGIE
jgi:hypothetical protein